MSYTRKFIKLLFDAFNSFNIAVHYWTEPIC